MLMFTRNLIPPMTDPSDIKVSKMIFDLWTSFAANGYNTSWLLTYCLHLFLLRWLSKCRVLIFCCYLFDTEYHKVTKLLAIGFQLQQQPGVISKSTWRVPFSQRRDAFSFKTRLLAFIIGFLFRCLSQRRVVMIYPLRCMYTLYVYVHYARDIFVIMKMICQRGIVLNSNSPDWWCPSYTRYSSLIIQLAMKLLLLYSYFLDNFEFNFTNNLLKEFYLNFIVLYFEWIWFDWYIVSKMHYYEDFNTLVQVLRRIVRIWFIIDSRLSYRIQDG